MAFRLQPVATPLASSKLMPTPLPVTVFPVKWTSTADPAAARPFLFPVAVLPDTVTFIPLRTPDPYVAFFTRLPVIAESFASAKRMFWKTLFSTVLLTAEIPDPPLT